MQPGAEGPAVTCSPVRTRGRFVQPGADAGATRSLARTRGRYLPDPTRPTDARDPTRVDGSRSGSTAHGPGKPHRARGSAE